MQFQTLDDILNFAIVQEKAAQKFYTKLSNEAERADMQLFYRTLVEEELTHEKKLRKLKSRNSSLPAPDLTDLQKSGYLDALPIGSDMTLKEVLLYALKKEKSAKMLYTVLSKNIQQAELVDLFKTLALEESGHADFFRKEYNLACAEAE